MIDSILLSIPHGQFQYDDDVFDSQDIKQINRWVGIKKRFSKNHAEWKKQGIYTPFITLLERRATKEQKANPLGQFSLEVQVSLPKLLWGISLWEVGIDDFEKIIKTLSESLSRYYKISVSIDAIRDASVKRIDFSKNLRIPMKYGNVYSVLSHLFGVSEKQRSDMILQRYGILNGAHSLKFYNSTQGLIFYDKLGQMLDEAHTKEEKQVQKWIVDTKQPRNVLRIELSLEKQQSMSAVLSRITGHKQRYWTFADIFSYPDISKNLLLETINIIFPDRYVIAVGLIEQNYRAYNETVKRLDLSFAEKSQLFYMLYNTATYGAKNFEGELKSVMPATTFRNYKNKMDELCKKAVVQEDNSPYLLMWLQEELKKFELFSGDNPRQLL